MSTRWVAFIRAINGSPHNRIKMVDLAALLEKAGARGVTWHLQTGNLFFEADEDLAVAMETELIAHGLRAADVMLRTPDQLRELIAREPFAGVDPEVFHRSVSFFRTVPERRPTEKLDALGAKIVYQDELTLCLAVPKTSALSGGASTVIDKPWRVASTTRWWHVVEAVAEKA
jgi:uncharacterized protein (DUF1697 family)